MREFENLKMVGNGSIKTIKLGEWSPKSSSAITHCGSDNVKRKRKMLNGKQRYHCKDYGRASLEHPDHGYSEARKEEILRAYQERSSMRGISRTFGIARNTPSA